MGDRANFTVIFNDKTRRLVVESLQRLMMYFQDTGAFQICRSFWPTARVIASGCFIQVCVPRFFRPDRGSNISAQGRAKRR